MTSTGRLPVGDTRRQRQATSWKRYWLGLCTPNGYRRLVSEQQDPDALARGAHGLLVRGRGADHQADVFGEPTLPTPFSLPLRIVVEAKYRGTTANLRDVRNAHGVAWIRGLIGWSFGVLTVKVPSKQGESGVSTP
jgi:hypothetical protein